MTDTMSLFQTRFREVSQIVLVRRSRERGVRVAGPQVVLIARTLVQTIPTLLRRVTAWFSYKPWDLTLLRVSLLRRYPR